MLQQERVNDVVYSRFWKQDLSTTVGPQCLSGPRQSDIGRAAVQLQKVYRSYRTRRLLADSAVVAEQLWWHALDYAKLNHSTISFFDNVKPETPASRWNRLLLNASKVGRGLSLDCNARILAFQHWIEAIDPRHRYGHSLQYYYDTWCKAETEQPFFFWLDVGDGINVDLEECSRASLRHQCIVYLGPLERQQYEYELTEGKIIHKLTGVYLDTATKDSKESKFIFVMSTSKKLYAGKKRKGMFHHSSFLAGGSTLTAGRLVVENGTLKSISPYSGHYRPTEENFANFLSHLKEKGIRLDEVEIKRPINDYAANNVEVPSVSEDRNEENSVTATKKAERKVDYKRNLSAKELLEPATEGGQKAILERINSKKEAKSYQLGHQLQSVWSTGAGPRIGCVADYPSELRTKALKFVRLQEY